MIPNIIIWHNKVCSTSKKALELIQTKTENLTVRDYIKHPPSIVELEDVLKKMNQSPTYILRKKDKVFQELFAHKTLSDQEWLEAMSLHPSIIERPIIIIDNKAFLGRPIEDIEPTINALM
jgi:arsenate reductase